MRIDKHGDLDEVLKIGRPIDYPDVDGANLHRGIQNFAELG